MNRENKMLRKRNIALAGLVTLNFWLGDFLIVVPGTIYELALNKRQEITRMSIDEIKAEISYVAKFEPERLEELRLKMYEESSY
ncbi:hypothetical protein J4408_02235 [Candidatus Pacearchaeota archaeon]|nr:hypothetical protein [Candidatus Pacearchaeota archaeon]